MPEWNPSPGGLPQSFKNSVLILTTDSDFYQYIKKIKSEVQGKIEKKISSGAKGMHEAILYIVKAMRDLKKYLS